MIWIPWRCQSGAWFLSMEYGECLWKLCWTAVIPFPSHHSPAGSLPPHPRIYVENCSLRTTPAQPAENAPFWVLAASNQYLLLVDSCLQCNFGEQKCYWPERETKLLFKATSAPKQNKQSVGQLPWYFSVDFLGFFPAKQPPLRAKGKTTVLESPLLLIFPHKTAF